MTGFESAPDTAFARPFRSGWAGLFPARSTWKIPIGPSTPARNAPWSSKLLVALLPGYQAEAD